MTSMHRRWSARVHVPTFGPSNSVAECMNWNNSQRRAAEARVAFMDEPEVIATTRYNGDIYSRPVTPYGLKKTSNTPIPSTEKAWTFSTEADNPPICNTPGHIIHVPCTPPPQDAYTDRYYNMNSSRRTPSRLYGKYDHADTLNPYTDRRDIYDTNQNHAQYDLDNEEILRDQLVRQQIESYERQIDFEKSKLNEDLHNPYSDHVRRAMTPSYLNERAVTDAVRQVSRHHPTQVHFDDPSRRYASKPPIPRPPKGKSIYPKTTYPRHVESRGTGHMQVSRPNSAYTSRQQYTDFQREPVGSLSGALTTKRVNFQTPRPGSAASMRDLQKSGHFFQWRDNTHQLPHPPPSTHDQPWKMSRFTRSAKPRIDSRWDRDVYTDSTYSGLENNNKVRVNVECEEGNNMDLNLQVSRTNDNAFVVL